MPKIKEIWCICHSHFDLGYTHPQPMLMELQEDFIDQAMELCRKTKDNPEESQFRWTCEATYPVTKWLEDAEPERAEEFIQLVKENRISVAALPMHTTPCVTSGKLVSMMRDLDDLRETLKNPIHTAITHDVNGQPWTLSQVLLDSQVDFYMTGINIHFGGVPFQRPMAFWWETPDKRKLLSYVGEHYSLFSQLFYTCENDTKRMHEGIEEYLRHLKEQNYPWDFVMLTATNPPMYDNNCPDWNLPELVKKYNEEGHEVKVRFATPEMFYEKLLSMGEDTFPVHRGDWTDYWNFGSGSSAREVRVNRLAQKTLESFDVLECMNGRNSKRRQRLREEAGWKSILYDEHTWGASQAISDPHDYESQSQYIHKCKLAYEAADLAGYLLAGEVEKLEQNPYQSEYVEGITVINPTGVTQNIDLVLPREWKNKESQLSGVRAKRYIPYIDRTGEKEYFAHENQAWMGMAKVPPYSYQVIPFTDIEKYLVPCEGLKKEAGKIETPYYEVSICESTGRIRQIFSKKRNRNILDEASPWSFFELVRETVDERYQTNGRKAIFPRDVDKGNYSISVWQHDWKAKRVGADRVAGWNVEIKSDRAELTWTLEMPGTKWVEQTVVFYGDREEIDLKVKLHKLPVESPEAYYLAFPLKLSADWSCAYNTAGQYVLLDEEQLGHVCRDFVTVDNGVALYDEKVCYGLCAFEAPLVQIGDFHFGQENRQIERKENPLLLAWPLNNYWDTNFVAAQSDVMEFSYRFYCKESFDKTQMWQEFTRGEMRGLIGAAVYAQQKTVKLLEASQEGVVTRIYPAKGEKNSFILQMKNQESTGKEVSIRFPAWKSFRADPVNMQEKETGAWKKEGEEVSISLKPEELILVKVTGVSEKDFSQ